MNRRRKLPAAIIAGCAVLALTTACSSSGAASTSSTDAASAGSSGAGAGLAAASSFLAKYEANPTSIGLDQKLSAPVPAGKAFIALTAPLETAQQLSKALDAASKQLGWSYTSIGTGNTAASAVSAFEAAIAKAPYAIAFSGFPASEFTKQIDEAKAAGIVVVSDNTGDGSVPGVLADLSGADQWSLYGQIAAAYFVTKSEGKGSAAVFTLNAYPVLADFAASFQKAAQEWCPSCSVEIVNQQPADLGVKTPTNVIAYLQQHPDTKWAVFANGGVATGVSAAITAAGMNDVTIVGAVPTAANLAGVQAGTEAAWVGYTTDILGWRELDLLARNATKDDATSAAAVSLPTQVITKDNISTIVANGGIYVGVDGYQNQFTKLWGSGS